MSRTVAGTLYKPDGNELGPATITFTAASTSENVIEGVSLEVAVASNGEYTVTLLNGNYLVHLDEPTQKQIYLGRIAVTTGSSVTLNYLLALYSPTASQDVIDYMDGVLEALPGTYQPIGNYLGTDYDLSNAPSNVSNFVATLQYRNIAGVPSYGINLDWDGATPASGDTAIYEITYYSDTEDPNPTIALTEATIFDTPYSLVLWESYTLELRVKSKRYPGVYYDGVAVATVSVIPEGVPSINLDDVTDASGLNFIIIRWEYPASAYTLSTYLYLSTDSYFTPSETTLIYYGTGTSFSYYSPDVVDYYIKFILVDSQGNQSATTEAYGPVSAMRMSSTTIGQLIEANTIEAQHLVDDIDISDKLAANTIVAGKLAVLNLLNLVENNNFTLYDSVNSTHNSWDYKTTTPIDPGPDGYIVLPALAAIDNEYQFSCSPEDKFYGAVTLSWSVAAGTAPKGFTVIFLDSDDNELNPDDTDGVEITTGYVASNTTSSAGTDVLVEGFCLAPATAVKGFIRLKTGAVSTNITFKNINCRFGSAVLIEDGEITADKINVATLWALNIWLEGTLRTYETAGVSRGIQLGSTVGLRFYDNSGNLLVDLNPSTGAATFAGSVSAVTLIGTNIVSGNLQLDTTGKLYTAGKTSYGDTTPGIFIGYESGAYKVKIGSSTKYLAWNGSTLTLSGALSAATGTFAGSLSAATGTFAGSLSAVTGSFGDVTSSGNMTVSGAVRGGKTAYENATAGFWLGNDNGTYKFHIGTNTNYLKWTGTALSISRTTYKAGGTWSGSKRILQIYWSATNTDNVTLAPTVEISTGYSIPYAINSTTGAGLVLTVIPTSVSGDFALSLCTATAVISAPLSGTGEVKIKASFFIDQSAYTPSNGDVSYITGFKWFLRELF